MGADNRALWDQLAAPFPSDQVESLPKQLRKEDRERADCSVARRGVCADEKPCGGYHARSIHLDYIGHAGVTMRLNAVDPTWTWEPMALSPVGTPLASDGGMWIRLTVLGVTRLGFGDAAGKTGPNAVKECIGDALRNAAMRFGVGTYLWSKSEAAQVIKAGGDPDAEATPPPAPQQQRRTGPAHTAPATVEASQREPEPPSTEEEPPPPGVDPSTGEVTTDTQPKAQSLADKARGKRTDATLRAVFEEAQAAGLLRTEVLGPDGHRVPLAAVISVRRAELMAAAREAEQAAG